MNQATLEKLLLPRHIHNRIEEEVVKHFQDQIIQGKSLLQEWLDRQYWESKQVRLESIRYLDLEKIVVDVLTRVLMLVGNPMPLVSLSGMMHLTDELSKTYNMLTVMEIYAVLKKVGLYSIETSPSDARIVTPLVLPSESGERRIQLGCYLPPLIERPKKLTSNDSSGLHTVSKDSLILGGKVNHHTGTISLDVLNKLNSIEYTLDETIDTEKSFHTTYLTEREYGELTLEDQQMYDLQVSNHHKAREQFNYLKEILRDKKLYFTHKYDKRGRVYSQGFHFNIQGTSYEKACLNLANKEVIHGEL